MDRIKYISKDRRPKNGPEFKIGLVILGLLGIAIVANHTGACKLTHEDTTLDGSPWRRELEKCRIGQMFLDIQWIRESAIFDTAFSVHGGIDETAVGGLTLIRGRDGRLSGGVVVTIENRTFSYTTTPK